MTIGTGHQGGPPETVGGEESPVVFAPVVATKQKRRRNTTKPSFEPREEIADLKSDVEYLRQQVHGLRSQLHGELAALALRIEDNDRREMLRRKVVRRWLMVAVFTVWLWQTPVAILRLLHGPILMPGLLLFGMTVAGGITILMLSLHNEADEQDQKHRYQNWFRLIARDDTQPAHSRF
jgi:hypothetical protein